MTTLPPGGKQESNRKQPGKAVEGCREDWSKYNWEALGFQKPLIFFLNPKLEFDPVVFHQ